MKDPMKTEEEYVFSSKELAVMLAAKGCSRLIGFDLYDTADIDQRQLLYQLYGLFKKDFITQHSDGHCLEISHPIDTILNACIESDDIFQIRKLYPDEIPFAVCYRGNNGWGVMRPCAGLPDGWLIQRKNTAEIVELLTDCQVISYVEQEMPRIQRMVFDFAEQMSENITPILSIERINRKSGLTNAKATISRSALIDWMQVENESECIRYPYTTGSLIEWLEEI